MATETSPQKIMQLLALDDFISGLHKLKEQDFTEVRGTLQYLQANRVHPEAIAPYLFWNAHASETNASMRVGVPVGSILETCI